MNRFTRTLCGLALLATFQVDAGMQPALTTEDVRKDREVRESDFTASRPSSVEIAKLQQIAGTGKVRVIVTLAQRMTPEGLIDESAAAVQRTAFRLAQDAVIAAIAPLGGEVKRRFQFVPQVALRVDAKTLDRLARMPGVARIQVDGLSAPTLQDSVPITGAADVQDRNVSGTGVVVAVLDTGLNLSHPFVRRFVAEACRSDGDCPNGSDSQTGPGAAAMCTYASQCDHGTHVAGIAIGAAQSGFTTLNGMAPGASVMPVQIFSRFTGSDCGAGSTSATVCARSFDSDQIAGLEYVFSQRNDFTIASVNMSLGDDSHHTSTCDGDSRKSIIDQLRSAGIATVIAAGNGATSTGAFTDGVGAPGCISTAITIGSVDKSDAMAADSQTASFIDLVAPGVGITSSCGGTSFCSKSGTSMATPHVAGAFALMRSSTTFNVSQELDILRDLGKRLHDLRPGDRVVKRINVFEAERLNEPALANAIVQNFRQPRPLDHRFKMTTTKQGWSAVATRPGPLVDVNMDLRTVSGSSATTAIAQSNSFGTTQIDVLAQDSNSGRRALGSTFPWVRLASGSGNGRYDIEYNESSLSLFTVGTVPFQPTTLVRVFNLPLAAGVPKFVRAVPAAGQNIEMLLFTDDAANAATWAKGRPQADRIVSSTTAADREFAFTPGQSGVGGLVLTQRAGSGTVTVYADSTAPTGSVAIDGGAASTASHDLLLTIGASDPETGVADMRISVDGVFDAEPWVPFSTSAHAFAPPGPGTATVSVQFRNQAHQVSGVARASIQMLSAVSASGTQIVEGNDGTRAATFQVNLDAPAPNPVSVRIDTVDGSATAGSDYTGISQIVTFAPGETAKPIDVAVNGDTEVEAHETFALALSSPSAGAQVTVNRVTATILNDDTGGAPATISIGDASVIEGAASTGRFHITRTLVFPLTLSAVSDAETTVDYQTRDGTAHGGTDYFVDGGTAAFAAGAVTTTIRIGVFGDSLGEVDESLFVELADAVGATIADGTGQGTIVNDDGTPVPALAIDDVRVTEGSSGSSVANFTVHLQPAIKATVTVQVASANGTATAGSDYTPLIKERTLDPNGPLTITFAPGETTKVVPVRVTGDTVREDDETFFVRLGAVTGGAAIEDGEGQATIVNDD